MIEFIKLNICNKSFKILMLVIILDTIFGILRALKEKNLNSTIGIDGIVRKVGMLISIVFLNIIDNLTSIDFLGFIPDSVKEFIHMQRVGVASLFNILFIIFEGLSVLKNMIKCKIPIPKKVKVYLEKILKEFTSEIKEKEGDKL